MNAADTLQDAELENARLRERLAEAESVLQAIRRGEIDAVVVSGPEGDRVFTLQGADHPYRLLVESMNEGAATLDGSGVILYSNPHLVSLLATSRTRLVGTPLANWVVPEDRVRLERLVQMSASQSVSDELTLLTSTGATLPVHASFSCLTIDDERFCCAIITDLSLAKHHAALELAAERIREANDRLRQADQRKDEFLATLAHELRNPLAPIRAAAEVIKMLDHPDKRLIHARDMIERQVSHMARLVDDLLELSRIALGRIALQRRTENLTSMLVGIAEAARATMQAAHVFTVDLPKEPLLLDADATRLSQAISNVLENAVKYTPPSGRIAFHAERIEDQAVIRIRDSGVGIDPEMLPRIFDMFVQVEQEGRVAARGLGIGLALSRRLLELHGGTIEASSPGRGQGSEFVIRLPLKTEAEEGTRSGLETQPTAPPQLVLIIDDNVDAADSLQMLLELSGHTVKAVHTATAALDTLDDFRPDLVLIDIGLPDLDGYEVARRLRARYGTQCPTLVALSGWGQAEDKKRATEAGIDVYFTKPVDPAALARVLSEHAVGRFRRAWLEPPDDQD